MFRHEVLNSKRDRLSGNIGISVPVSWQAVGMLIFAIITIAVLYLSFSSYYRTETVTGQITPESGLSEVIPTRSGILESLLVKEGQEVKAGDKLAVVRVEEEGSDQSSPGSKILDAIYKQDESLSAQTEAARQTATAQIAQINAQSSGIQAEIAQLQGQLSAQQVLINSAQADLDKAREVSERGFISRRDLQSREDALTSRQQAMAQIKQAIAAKQAEYAQTQRSAGVALAQMRAQTASLEASRAQVAQQAESTAGNRSYVLRATKNGRVSALTAREGQFIQAQNQIMAVVPHDTRLIAELAVPSAAIGFIKPGQDVRLSIDAFSYQRFGTVPGKIETVSGNAVAVQAKDGSIRSVYPVRVRLLSETIRAYGKDAPLVPGMTLTARVIIEKQTLLEWLFEPIFAMQRK